MPRKKKKRKGNYHLNMPLKKEKGIKAKEKGKDKRQLPPEHAKEDC